MNNNNNNNNNGSDNTNNFNNNSNYNFNNFNNNNRNNQFQHITDLSKKYEYKNSNNNRVNNFFMANKSNNNNNNNEIKKRKLPWVNYNDEKPNKLKTSSVNLSLAVYNENEISIHVSKSNIPKIRLYFSSMENSHYSPQETCWIVPLSKYKTILRDSKEGKIIPGTITKVEEIPDFVLNVFSSNYTNAIHPNNDSNENIAKLMEERIPKSLLSKLMRFQYMGVREAILKNGRVFLCDEMGLGILLLFYLNFYYINIFYFN